TAPLLATGMVNQKTAGHYDVTTRLADMDGDGVAAEVIFHSSQNWEPIPFVRAAAIPGNYETDIDLELAGVGQHIYNEWLADIVSVQPERHVGLAYLPMWTPKKLSENSPGPLEGACAVSISPHLGPTYSNMTTQRGNLSGPRVKTSGWFSRRMPGV